jgi:transcriptional regulator GlxA family with amidase domain
MHRLEYAPDTRDALVRFCRQCQVSAAAFLPPTDTAQVLSAVWRALRAFPEITEEATRHRVIWILLGLARHTLDRSWQQAVLSPAGIRGQRRWGILALEAIIAADRRRPISLAALAKSLSVSRWHLCRAVRQATGVGLPTHLSGLRVLEATLLLADSDLSVEAIANALGYRYASGLDRDFEKWFHLSPTKVRQAYWTHDALACASGSRIRVS